MGLVYARDVLGIENPRVGLMNIGSEDGKGTELYRDTHAALQQIGDRVGQNAVDLFGHRAVAASESGFDVRHANAQPTFSPVRMLGNAPGISMRTI